MNPTKSWYHCLPPTPLFQSSGQFEVRTHTTMDNQGVPIAAAALAIFLVFLYNRRSQPRKTIADTNTPLKQQKSSGVVRAKRVDPKPKDGTVRISGIFIHPIKVCIVFRMSMPLSIWRIDMRLFQLACGRGTVVLKAFLFIAACPGDVSLQWST